MGTLFPVPQDKCLEKLGAIVSQESPLKRFVFSKLLPMLKTRHERFDNFQCGAIENGIGRGVFKVCSCSY